MLFFVLEGQGILLCHDNTKFEGDFCGDAQINGKVRNGQDHIFYLQYIMGE